MNACPAWLADTLTGPRYPMLTRSPVADPLAGWLAGLVAGEPASFPAGLAAGHRAGWVSWTLPGRCLDAAWALAWRAVRGSGVGWSRLE